MRQAPIQGRRHPVVVELAICKDLRSRLSCIFAKVIAQHFKTPRSGYPMDIAPQLVMAMTKANNNYVSSAEQLPNNMFQKCIQKREHWAWRSTTTTQFFMAWASTIVRTGGWFSGGGVPLMPGAWSRSCAASWLAECADGPGQKAVGKLSKVVARVGGRKIIGLDRMPGNLVTYSVHLVTHR